MMTGKIERLEAKAKVGLPGHVVGNMRRGIAVVYNGEYAGGDSYAYYHNGETVSRGHAERTN